MNCKKIFISFFFLCIHLFSCKNIPKIKEKDIVKKQEEIDGRKSMHINTITVFALQNKGRVTDSIKITNPSLVESYYKKKGYKSIWSKKENWLSVADSLYNFIENSRLYGLFPSDYNYYGLNLIRNKFSTDTLSVRDAVLWAKADVLLTDAFFSIVSHLRIGRIERDSVSLNPDSVLAENFFYENLDKALAESDIKTVVDSLEPRHPFYKELRGSIKSFLDSANLNYAYTWITYPFKDSSFFINTLVKRLREYGAIPDSIVKVDSVLLSSVIKKVQKEKGLRVDGKFGPSLVRMLNNTDEEKFKRIAITLDRYKQLPDTMPPTYVMINLAGFYLKLWDNDTVVFESKIVVGKPETRTPVLNSYISNIITYPQWTIPTSIIVKEILPALKKDTGYLEKKGYMLLNAKNELVDPGSVDWSKYTKGIPYKIVQGSGDDNALGVLKFNFGNKYSVYLHDTNQRYYFARSSRALSHGCVRVEKWQNLAYFILERDTRMLASSDSLTYLIDSLRTWLSREERHTIIIKNKLPLYIRYFGCDVKNKQIVFFDDIYGEDKELRERYFANKN
ncbi:MAG TPA: L,D-transpeptidase family protein [Chitinophagaceae bacterium]|nr:L,D-transpeptidase family protein [Chitinophagaceae bacterium]